MSIDFSPGSIRIFRLVCLSVGFVLKLKTVVVVGAETYNHKVGFSFIPIVENVTARGIVKIRIFLHRTVNVCCVVVCSPKNTHSSVCHNCIVHAQLLRGNIRIGKRSVLNTLTVISASKTASVCYRISDKLYKQFTVFRHLFKSTAKLYSVKADRQVITRLVHNFKSMLSVCQAGSNDVFSIFDFYIFVFFSVNHYSKPNYPR